MAYGTVTHGDQGDVSFSGQVLDGDAILRRRMIEKSTPPGVVRLVEWNGIVNGQHVRVKGAPGTYRFMYFHKDDHQEFVQVYGGKAGHGGVHCFAPDRIVPPRRRRTRSQ